jgi:hypothetical protein
MEAAAGAVAGLVFWAFVLGGIVAVPVGAILVQVVFDRSWRTSLKISSTGWYLGIPVLFFSYISYDDWQNKREVKRLRDEYLALCQKSASESILKVTERVEWIRLDTGERDNRYARPMYAAFGANYDSMLFQRRAEERAYKNWGKYKNIETVEKYSGPFLILRIRATDLIPAWGSFYATQIDLEVIDPATNATLAQRRTFTTNASSQDCNGINLFDSNLDFLQRAVVPKNIS